jgi:hypothetical protein
MKRDDKAAVVPGADADATALLQLIMGFRLTQMVYAAAKLGVADHLREGPRTAQAFAEAVGAHPQSLGRLLRGLASVGIFSETETGEFELTARGRFLCSDTPGSLRSLAVLYGEDWLWRGYGNTLHSVRTGGPGFDHAHGAPLYDYLETHPEAALAFDAAMSGYSALEAKAILDAYDFSAVRTFIDVGGGLGELATTLLRAHAHLVGTIYERAGTIEQTRRAVTAAGLSERCNCVGGDFFVSVPPADGVVLLKSVIHNWDDEKATAILRNCRRGMQPGARLLIAERVIAPGNAAPEAKLFDISMLVVVGGQERTPSEYGALLAAAGFELTRIIPTASSLSLIEARLVAAPQTAG